VTDALKRRGNWIAVPKEEECVEKCHFVFRPFNYSADQYKRIDRRIVRSAHPFVYNHFEYVRCLTTKSGLVRSLKQYYFNSNAARAANYSAFSTLPTTFLLSSGQKDAEMKDFTTRYFEITKGHAPKERIPLKHCVNNIWLVKPANAN